MGIREWVVGKIMERAMKKDKDFRDTMVGYQRKIEKLDAEIKAKVDEIAVKYRRTCPKCGENKIPSRAKVCPKCQTNFREYSRQLQNEQNKVDQSDGGMPTESKNTVRILREKEKQRRKKEL